MKNEELFRVAVKEHDQMIRRICYHFFGPGDNADDAHQEILLKIWLNVDKFRHEAKIKTWIYRISVNVCITLLSRLKKRSAVFIHQENLASTLATEEKPDKSDEEIRLQFFRNFMDTLDIADKVLVSLYLEELDTREIADITGLSESNVRVKIHRIKNKIKQEWMVKYGTR